MEVVQTEQKWQLIQMLFYATLSAGGIMFLSYLCVWMSRKFAYQSLLTHYIINHLREFHQIYNFAASGDKDELIRF